MSETGVDMPGFSRESGNLNFYMKTLRFLLLASNSNLKHCASQVKHIYNSWPVGLLATSTIDIQNCGNLGEYENCRILES